MKTFLVNAPPLFWALVALPAIVVARIVVPEVVRLVVPEVVRTVLHLL